MHVLLHTEEEDTPVVLVDFFLVALLAMGGVFRRNVSHTTRGE